MSAADILMKTYCFPQKDLKQLSFLTEQMNCCMSRLIFPQKVPSEGILPRKTTITPYKLVADICFGPGRIP